MAFNEDKISKLSNLSPPSSTTPSASFWVYEGAETLAVQVAAGYFNNWRDQLQVGDKILVIGTNGVELITVATVPAAGNITVTRTDRGVAGVAAGYAIARGQHTTVDENDTLVTGLGSLVSIVVSLDDDPVDGCMHVTASIGDQAGAPAAGSALIKTWKSTDADATLVAASTFGKKVNWIAIGLP